MILPSSTTKSINTLGNQPQKSTAKRPISGSLLQEHIIALFFCKIVLFIGCTFIQHQIQEPTSGGFFTVFNFNEMQKLNSTDIPRLPKDKREKQPSTLQHVFLEENVQVLLEVEVIESLYAAMSKKNKNCIGQSGAVEVTIIRPETAEPFMHCQEKISTLSTVRGHSKKICEFQYHAKPYRRPATSATNRCRVPHLDRQQNKSFLAENLIEGPAINVDEIVGDLPSKVTGIPRITVPENSMKLRHGDHCDSFISDLGISSKVRGTMASINPLAYHIHLEAKGIEENRPLVELSVAEKILEAYELDDATQKLIGAMRNALREWGSDEKRIADTLYSDKFSLMRCEHCGVISFKQAQALLPTLKDEFSVKDNVEQVDCEDEEKYLRTRNTEANFCHVNADGQVSRNEFNDSISWSKTSTCLTENEAVKDKLKVQNLEFEKGTKNSAKVKTHDLYYKSDTKMMLRRSTNAENIDGQSVVDKTTVEREKDSMSENTIKMVDVGKKKKLKTVPPLVTTNKNGRCSNVQSNEKSNDTCFKNTYSTRYSPRQNIPKTVKKPDWKTCPDNCRNKNNFETRKNRTENQGKKSALLGKDSEKTTTLNCNKNKADNNGTNDSHLEVETNQSFLLQESSRKIKFTRSLVPRSNTPAKLEKTSSSKPSTFKNLANYLVREKASAIDGKGKQSFIPSRNKPRAKADLWVWKNQTLLAGSGIQEDSQDQDSSSSNLTKNLLRHCDAYSDDKLSTDQEYGGKNDRRSFRSMKSRKCDQINPDFNCSAPTIGARKTFGNEDFVIDPNLADNTLHGESETTAFSSSSSENVIRGWANSLVQVQRFDCQSLAVKSNDDLSSDSIQSIGTQIDKASAKCSTYNVGSEGRLYSTETLTEPDNAEKLDQQDVSCDLNYANNQHERFSANGAMHSSSASIASTFDSGKKEARCKTTENLKKLGLVEDTTSFTVGQSETPQSQKNVDACEGILFGKEKYPAIRTSVSKTLNKSSNDRLNVTYKNSASVISSSSEYSNEHRQEPDVQQRSLCDRKNGSVLQFTGSETFESQITYNEISSKDITEGSEESLKARAQPAAYRKILESKDEMDWETFQRLVGTLHPSQRELWSDICKAVSNEAKRVAGETGASTEVCIEINPVPTIQAFSCGERKSRVKTSGNEISFEMDMILTDSQSFFDQKSRDGPNTLHEPEKCR